MKEEMAKDNVAKEEAVQEEMRGEGRKIISSPTILKRKRSALSPTAPHLLKRFSSWRSTSSLTWPPSTQSLT